MSGFSKKFCQNTIIMNNAIARNNTPTKNLSKLQKILCAQLEINSRLLTLWMHFHIFMGFIKYMLAYNPFFKGFFYLLSKFIMDSI